MKEIMIVKATVADLKTLQAVGKETYSETFGPYNTKENLSAYLTKAFSDDQLTKELNEPNSQWFLALVGNETAGFMKVNFGNAQTELQDNKAMEIERIYVLQRFQGNNLGKLLMEKSMAVAREHRVEYIWLGVWEHNPKAVEFYKRQGFVRFSQHSFFVGDDEQTDWMMKLTLADSTIPKTEATATNG